MKQMHADRAVAFGWRGFLLATLMHALPTLTLASSAVAPAGAGTPPQRCGAPIFGRDRMDLVCSLDPIATPQRIHIKVRFTGSHDDTTASLNVEIGGAPVACESGSKTSTEFEDGDVALDCQLTTSVKPGAAKDLRVSAKWFHAQYVDFEVDWRLP